MHRESSLNAHAIAEFADRICFGKERVQIFQGNIISIFGSGIAETYTVRKLSYGVGVERTFPMHSPSVAKLEVVKRGDVRRAKLNYLRERTGKAAKVRELREDQ